MNYPSFCYAATVTSTPRSILPGHDMTYNSLTDRIKMFMNYIDEDGEKDLYNFFIQIVQEIFGHGSAKGWTLDKMTGRMNNDQNYMCLESDCVYNFLCSNGYMFKLCYKLIANSVHKFNVYFTDIPAELKQKIEQSYANSFYGLRFLYHIDSNVPVGFCLNSFEYYMFHFVLYGLKLTSNDIISVNDKNNEQSVYVMLCLEYFNSFFPSFSTVLPELQFNVLSTISNTTQCTSPRKLLNFIKKDVACNEFSNKVENSWILTSEATWRTETVAFLFADIWLNCNTFNIPSITLTKLVRCFIKQLHLYSNRNVTHNLNLTARHGTKIYQYLSHYMNIWQQDFSFRFFLENWLCYIRPWRYEYFDKKHLFTEHEINEKWKIFIVRNLLCYTKLFSIVIKRFLSIDICSPRYSDMALKVLKVFNHPYLLKIIFDVEHMYLTNEPQYKKWNNLLLECLLTDEGSMFKYELMFSEDRRCEYKLFLNKLQKSICHAEFELSRFQKNSLYNGNSSFFESILSHRIDKISDYTYSEWEEILKNLKSSFKFMEQIINTNADTTRDISFEWSLSSVSDTTNVFNKINSHLLDRSMIKLSSKKKNELEIDPDYLGTLQYESDLLVKLSKYLRSIVERYWNSYVLKFSVENSIFAGVIRQALIRPPMKIYSYEARSGSGKRVRTPKIVPPTISFRWIASYFTLSWILFFFMLIWTCKNVNLWIGLFFVFRVIYWCIKYLMGYAPPFKWGDFHEK